MSALAQIVVMLSTNADTSAELDKGLKSICVNAGVDSKPLSKHPWMTRHLLSVSKFTIQNRKMN
jgi:hypothetical protein